MTKVEFNGSTSTDNIKIVSYVWELVSGPVDYQAEFPYSPSISMTNLTAGNYTIRLTVTDNEGLSDTATATLVVLPIITTTTTTPTTMTTTTTTSTTTTPPIPLPCLIAIG